MERLTVSLGQDVLSYRKVGHGEPIVFIHGWPFNSQTFDALVGDLGAEYTCLLPDSLGLGESRWSEQTDFTFPGQAKAFQAFLDRLALDSYWLVAHDTGATIARLLAAEDRARVRGLVLLNTEVPGERPPWLPLYQRLMGLPGAKNIFRTFLRSRVFMRSPAGFGGCYHDSALLDSAFRRRYLEPLIADERALEGAVRYFRQGLDFALIDRLPEVHARLDIPTLFVWGEADPTFPVAPARQMSREFPQCVGFETVPHGKLLAHEEFPDVVVAHIQRFLKAQR